MSVVTRCGAVGLMLSLLAGAAPVLAQTAPTETPSSSQSSSWTDPPVRGAAVPDTPAPAKPSVAPLESTPPAAAAVDETAKTRQSAAPPPASTPAERASAALGVKPVEADEGKVASASRTRRSVVRPRMVERPLILARRPGRLVERPAGRRSAHLSRRTIQRYAFAPEIRSYGRVDPHDGRGYAAPRSRRRLAGWDGLIGDDSGSRIARARESGYLVMRMRTYDYPDGMQVRHLLPYGGAGFGEFD